jgi:hypothetical protein
MRTAGVTSRLLGGPCFQSSHSRYRLPCLPWDASSKSIGFPPLEPRAAQDRTSLTRKSTRTRRYGQLRSGTTSVPGHRGLRRIALDEFLHHVHTPFLIYLNLNISGKICNRPKNDDPSLAEPLHAEPSRYENHLARALSTKHSSCVNYEKPQLILQAGNFNCLILSGVFFLKCPVAAAVRHAWESPS